MIVFARTGNVSGVEVGLGLDCAPVGEERYLYAYETFVRTPRVSGGMIVGLAPGVGDP